MNDLRQHLIDVRVGVNKHLPTMALISGADIPMPAFESQEDILNIHRDKVAKTF